MGVDINRAICFPHTAGLVQFVCGLGPQIRHRNLIDIIKQQNENQVENRSQLRDFMSKTAFINSAAFIRINTKYLQNDWESRVNILDGSRIHPESYELAERILRRALDEDLSLTEAVKKIRKTPELLDNVDLDAFADELEREGLGNKRITLNHICSELIHPYKDLKDSNGEWKRRADKLNDTAAILTSASESESRPPITCIHVNLFHFFSLSFLIVCIFFFFSFY